MDAVIEEWENIENFVASIPSRKNTVISVEEHLKGTNFALDPLILLL